MLLSLSIKNLILIDSLTIDFKRGLSTFTGETGAGKSIILDALMYALGARANAELIKDHSSNAVVSATFRNTSQTLKDYLTSIGIESDDQIIFRRIIYPNSTSKAFINDVNVKVSTMAEISKDFIEICGQHDSRGLMDNSKQIDILDHYLKLDLNKLNNLHTQYKTSLKSLEELRGRVEKSEVEKAYLTTVVDDLKELEPKEKEEEELAEQRKFLNEKSKISNALENSIKTLTDPKIMGELHSSLRDLEKYEDYFKSPISSLNSGVIELEETLRSLQQISDASDFNSLSLEEIEDRLFSLRSAARKYHTLPNLLPEFLEKKLHELSLIDNLDESISTAEALLEDTKKRFFELATEYSKKRINAGDTLSKAINNELKQLMMEKASFSIDIQSESDEINWTGKGYDKITFKVQTNPGQPFSPLSKTASGGELSRIMLAIKVALTKSNENQTLIFDEIDTGISGAVSDSVGLKLSELAGNSQVLVVTHQPQVAAYSNNHYLVSKIVKGSLTSVNTDILNADEKESEIARMISGQKVSGESIAAAKELIKNAA